MRTATAWHTCPVIVVNIESVPGHRIVELRGLVQGNTIRAKHLGRDIGAGLKNLVGGELRAYTELMTEARREALERMLEQARQLNANAVVNVRFTTTNVANGAAELYAYGTAVVVVADSDAAPPTG
jgi:uncharacterized protein YbjQ (UPF0145 family)